MGPRWHRGCEVQRCNFGDGFDRVGAGGLEEVCVTSMMAKSMHVWMRHDSYLSEQIRAAAAMHNVFLSLTMLIGSDT